MLAAHLKSALMIHATLSLLREELDAFIKSLDDNTTDDQVILGNISQLDTEDGDKLHGNVVLTLVNVEEESALKNRKLPRYQEGDKILYENPPVNLNLYLLFTACWPTNYDNAIKRLGHVVSFFQHRNQFTLKDATHFADGVDPDDEELSNLRLVLDLYTMTFEQINHLWGSLGGKQAPFVMYKARLASVRYRQTKGSGTAIEDIRGSLNGIN
ncbi:hypothetical protein CRP01_12435 [Flavilitoribacter nigricans DSM 23189 = NBRC 102662]|uniref:Pvc16 N-terminal domain-containing protein n=2 Tax=Flavilitoribacter TaxID=2762562 RepID=A0A2D0NDB6_FLAN2|nr:hypothetical protein CRP01_12435 [Flavilitoribacter nigricans DSM 23189 = NBRC 102662]